MNDKMDFQLLSFGMRRIGWIRFWIQSILGVVVTAVLIFSNVVNNNSEGQLSLTPGLSLTTISLILLFLSLWQGWLIIRTGRAIGSNARPSRGQTSKLIKRGIINDLLGILFGLIGYQALMGALFIQASTQTQGIAIATSSDVAITGLEILSVLSNTQVMAAHFVGLCFSLWLLRRIYKS
ncbi:MAG: hypothetical protein CMK49_01195 [Prochlorococcus sp. SP3034]|nr:hypothetical protein [Prochlorococcus sp. SP3034]|tara:strand:- start:5991 stop:6530 length:540 start_codon:yes stop_codon:yes gene_type:complete